LDQGIESNRQGKQDSWPTQAIDIKSGNARRLRIVLDAEISPDAGCRGAFEKHKGRCAGSGHKSERWIARHEESLYRRRQEPELLCALALACLFSSGCIL